jgi:galactose-1-phosphate uridylyltransferase
LEAFCISKGGEGKFIRHLILFTGGKRERPKQMLDSMPFKQKLPAMSKGCTFHCQNESHT